MNGHNNPKGASLDRPARARTWIPGGDEFAGIEHDDLLMTGYPVHIAPAELSDIGRVRKFYDRLSDTATYFRFFGIRRGLPERELREVVDPVVAGHVTLLATVDGELAGIGEFIVSRANPDEAEVAFVVADNHHREGIATLLLENLVLVARRRGLAALTVVTLPNNADMLLVFRTVGLCKHSSLEDEGVVNIRFDLGAQDDLQSRSNERHSLALENARLLAD